MVTLRLVLPDIAIQMIRTAVHPRRASWYVSHYTLENFTLFTLHQFHHSNRTLISAGLLMLLPCWIGLISLFVSGVLPCSQWCDFYCVRCSVI
jgi:hypothetical protein